MNKGALPTLPNGTQATYSYDPASQVTQIRHASTVNGHSVNTIDYVYNGVGNRTSLTDRRGAQAFGYDNLDRLTSASHPLLATPQAFSYDPVGNRTPGGSVHNAGNQLTADATHSYQYDDNGNLTRKTLLATGNYTQYTYDAENRLTKVEDFAAGNPTAFATSTYRYDGLGRKIEKVANGITRRYVYDGEDILLEYDGTNTLQARYTHGPGIDEPIAMTKGSSTFFYHQDALRTVTELTDSTGATARTYAYDVWGNQLEVTGTVENPYSFTGREFDTETNLYHYRTRQYDALTGRFLQADPLRFGGGDLNIYAYVLGNPTKFSDPLGLFSLEDIGDALIEGTKRGIETGYYNCLLNCLGGSVGAPLPGWLIEHTATEIGEHFAGPAARTYYSWKYPKWFTAGGRYSKVLVPNAIQAVKSVGRAVGVAGLGLLIYEEYECANKCLDCFTKPATE